MGCGCTWGLGVPIGWSDRGAGGMRTTGSKKPSQTKRNESKQNKTIERNKSEPKRIKTKQNKQPKRQNNRNKTTRTTQTQFTGAPARDQAHRARAQRPKGAAAKPRRLQAMMVGRAGLG